MGPTCPLVRSKTEFTVDGVVGVSVECATTRFQMARADAQRYLEFDDLRIASLWSSCMATKWIPCRHQLQVARESLVVQFPEECELRGVGRGSSTQTISCRFYYI